MKNILLLLAFSCFAVVETNAQRMFLAKDSLEIPVQYCNGQILRVFADTSWQAQNCTILPPAGYTINGNSTYVITSGEAGSIVNLKTDTTSRNIKVLSLNLLKNKFFLDPNVYEANINVTTNGSGEFTITHGLGNSAVYSRVDLNCDACSYKIYKKTTGLTSTSSVYQVRNAAGTLVGSGVTLNVDVYIKAR